MIVANHTEQSVTNQEPKTQAVYRFAKMLESIRLSGLLDAEDVKIVKVKRPNIGRIGKGNFESWTRLGEIRISVFQYTSNGNLIEKLITCTSKENDNYYSWDSNKKYLSANYIVFNGDYLGYGKNYGRRKRSKDFINILSEYIDRARKKVEYLMDDRNEYFRKIDSSIKFLADNVPTIGGLKINSLKRWMQRQVMAVINGDFSYPTTKMNDYIRLSVGMFPNMHHLMEEFPKRLTTFDIEPQIDDYNSEGNFYHVADVDLPQYYLHEKLFKKWLQFKLEEWEMFGALGKRKASLYHVETIRKDKEPRRFAEFLRYAKEQARYLELDYDKTITYSIDYYDNTDILTNNLFIRANNFTHRQDNDKYSLTNVSWLYVQNKDRAIKTLDEITIYHKVKLD